MFDSARARGARSTYLVILHPNGRKLLARLTVGGPLTLVLDECHHLLEIWGRLLRAIVTRLDDPHIIGLTATPPQLMTADQAVLHRELFGTVDLEVSTPALVRSGLGAAPVRSRSHPVFRRGREPLPRRHPRVAR